MFCRKCGKKLSASIKFCGLCGTQSKFSKEIKQSNNQMNLEKPKEKYAPSPYAQKEFSYTPLPKITKNNDSPNKVHIIITLAVISTLLVSSLWLYKNYEVDTKKC